MCCTIILNIFLIVIIGFYITRYIIMYVMIRQIFDNSVGQWKLLWAVGSGNPTSPLKYTPWYTYTKPTPKHIHHHYAPSVTLTHHLFNCTHIITPGFVDRPHRSGCVSSCRWCMFVSCVHPVAILNAAFCMTCSLLMFVEDARGHHMEETYSRGGLVTAL